MNTNLTRTLKVAVIDDHPALRSGICGWLLGWEHGKVVLEASDRMEYEELVKKGAEVDIAIVGLSMPRRDGYATIKWIKANQPRTIPIAMTFDPAPEPVRNALKSGAHGVLGKSIGKAGLLAALEQVRVSGYCVDLAILNELLDSTAKEKEAADAHHQKIAAALTKREQEFLIHLLAPDDPTYGMIAARMGVSCHTVESLRKNLFKKLGVFSRQGLFRAAMAWKEGVFENRNRA